MQGRVARCGLAVVLLAMTVLCPGPAGAEQTQIPPEEYAALVALYEATDGANWTDNWTLPTDDPCALFGVTCETEHVVSISLNNNNLVGTLPPDLGALAYLRVLNLQFNELGGTIPSELGGLANLQALLCYDNNLEGAIPSELGSLSSLLSLQLDFNQLTGELPPELGLLSSLQTLGVSHNQISGELPPELGNLSQLTQLHLSSNQLSGSIPSDLTSLAGLQELSLDWNNLSGGIPAWLGNLGELQHLGLAGNQFSGEIPSGLGSLSKLRGLVISYNQLGGEFPTVLTGLSNLQYLDVSQNQLTGSLPASLGNLSDLRTLRAGGNQLTGPIPAELGSLTALTELNLAVGQLSGPIPPQLGGLASLWWLDLQSNYFTGTVPAELGLLTNLRQLNLAANELGGAIPPQLGNLISLEHLDLGANQLSGIIPDELGNLTSLHALSLQNNELSGSIPPSLGSLAELSRLVLSQNQLSGSIPLEFGDLVGLEHLDLQTNQLAGPVPPQLGGLTGLQRLDLCNNQLSGPVPAELSLLSNLQFLNLSHNLLSSLPPELGTLSGLQFLYLDANQLTGAIPPEFGGLSSLEALSLNENRLSGTIPPEIGTLGNLQYLDLRYNQLSGRVPTELADLASTQWLYLGYNMLWTDDDSVAAWLTDRDPTWTLTQTIPPADLSVCAVAGGAEVSWTRIPYTGDYGYYEIGSSIATGGPYDPIARTPDKATASVTLPALQPGTTHYLAVRTYTPAHDMQQSDLLSSYGVEVIFTAPLVAVGEVEIVGPSLCAMASDCALTATVSPTDATLPITYTWSPEPLRGQGTAAATYRWDTEGQYSIQVQAENAGGTVSNTHTVSVVAQVQIPQGEYDALVALYNATDGANWTNTWTLPTQNPCGLYGVTCEGGHVVQLDLRSNQLSGPIPAALGALGGLRILYLDGNALTGGIPPELGDLSALENLNLNDNRLSGGIPPELGSLSTLYGLYLGSNQLSGSIPSEMGNLARLDGLNLASNQLSGSIPSSFGNLTALTALNLGYNQLSGPIAPEIGNAAELWWFGAEANALSGPIPSELSSLTKLEFLNLGYNMLYTDAGPLLDWLATRDPDWVDTQTVPPSEVLADGSVLRWTPIPYSADGGHYEVGVSTTSGGPYSFTLQSANKLATGVTLAGVEPGVPYYAVVRTFTPAHALSYGPQQNDLLSHHSEEVSSTVPLVALSGVSVSPSECATGTDCTFTATVTPPDATQPLTYTWSPEPLSGQGTASAVYRWDAEGQQTIGVQAGNAGGAVTATHNVEVRYQVQIPQAEYDALVALYSALDGPNWTNGWTLPTHDPCGLYGVTCADGHVWRILLSRNGLDGAIPPELADLTGLEHLYLTWDSVSGSIPPELGALTGLRTLNLGHNLISGAIPAELGALTLLESMDLRCNRLSGSVPSSLSALTNLQYLGLGYNMLWTDDASLSLFLQQKSPGWTNTQTVPPRDLQGTPLIGGAALSWTPIPYIADGGYYQVGIATSAGGPYSVVAQTADKTATGVTLSGLQPGTPYYAALRAFTPAHDNQQSPLTSPFGEEVAVTPASAAVVPTSVAIGAPTAGSISTPHTFTATVSPAEATEPLTYTWTPEPASGQGTASATYTWSTAGTQTITVTVSNAAGSASASHTISIVVPPSAVAITGPTEGSTGAPQSFLATVSPADATAPLTYTWSPIPTSGQGTAQAAYTWAEAGEKAVTVSVEGSGATVTATHTFLALAATTGATSPEAGGTLSAEEGAGQRTTVEVPAGAVTEAVTLAYAPLEAPPEAPAGYQFAGRRFTLDAYRDGECLEGVQFAALVTVTLAYTDAEVEGLDESTLVLHTWNGSAWVDAATSCAPASTYVREVEENRLSVGICHLSEFAVFGQPERVPQGHFALALPLVKR